MSLISALRNSGTGLRLAEAQANITSQNIANADRQGYTKKTYQTNFDLSQISTTLNTGFVRGSIDQFLSKAVIEDVALQGRTSALERLFDTYSREVGSTNTQQTLSGHLDSFYKSLQALQQEPESTAFKSTVVQQAEILANEIRVFSETIQGLRLEADKQIDAKVNDVNRLVQSIQDLNERIVRAVGTNEDVANLQDQRLVELENLSKIMGITYFENSQGRIQIYSEAGQPLLNSQVIPMTYTPVGGMSSATLYPGGINPIQLGGLDITTSFQTGELAGLIQARDSVFVQEQQKLDEFTRLFMREVNRAINTGTPSPPPTSFTGTVQGLTPATVMGGAGTFSIARTDINGNNIVTTGGLGPFATVNDALIALNALPGINAALNGAGQLVVTATNANEFLAINVGTTSIPPNNENIGSFFGLNSIFAGTDSTDLRVNTALSANPQRLASSVMNPGAPVGAPAVQRSNNNAVQNVIDVFSNTISFNAAGNFVAQTNTLLGYSGAFIGDIATRTTAARNNARDADAIVEVSRSELSNQTGVNIDEESAELVLIQNSYAANAQVLSTVQEMFDTLLQAYR